MAETTMDRLFDEPAGPPTEKNIQTREAFGGRARWAAPWLVMLIVAAAISPFRSHWVVQVGLLGWMLLAPGRLALVAMRIRPIQVRRSPIYTLALSLLVIMLTGLAVDSIGIASGIDRPLSTVPLWVGTATAYLLLLAGAAAAPRLYRPQLSPPSSLLPYLVLLLPLLAAAGAARLNSGNGSTLALIAMIALVAVWLISPFMPGFTWRSASITVYAVSLAGMWSFSLRGDSVYGYDIVTENFIAQNTARTEIWHLAHVNDAYGSLPSVTILPASLHSLTGTAVLLLFKVAVPSIFAFVPVAVLQLAGRVVSLPWSYVATGIVVGQVFFLAGIPAVTRQAFAFVFAVTLIAAILERSTRVALVLVSAGAAGLVLSHYSSTYMAVAMFGVAAVVALFLRLRKIAVPTLIVLAAFAAVLAGSIVWYFLLTRSGSNLTAASSNLRANGPQLLPNRSGGLISTLLNGNVSRSLTASDYQRLVADRYARQYGFVKAFAGASAEPVQAASPVPGTGAIGAIGQAAVAVVSQAVNVLAAVGAFILAFSRSRSRVERAFGILGLGTLVFLVLVRVSGTLAQSYNLERAQLQGFIVLAPVAVWTLRATSTAVRSRLSKRRKLASTGTRQRSLTLAFGVVATSLLVANASGLVTRHPTGGGRGNLGSSGEDAARFVTRSQDLAGARWLGLSNPGLRTITYSDVYGRLRLVAATGNTRNVLTDLTPATLNQQGWIFAYSSNTTGRKVARSTYDGGSVIYKYPFSFISSHYDRVYTNGLAQVFHR